MLLLILVMILQILKDSKRILVYTSHLHIQIYFNFWYKRSDIVGFFIKWIHVVINFILSDGHEMFWRQMNTKHSSKKLNKIANLCENLTNFKFNHLSKLFIWIPYFFITSHSKLFLITPKYPLNIWDNFSVL